MNLILDEVERIQAENDRLWKALKSYQGMRYFFKMLVVLILFFFLHEIDIQKSCTRPQGLKMVFFNKTLHCEENK